MLSGFGGVFVRLAHGIILSRNGASLIPGAIHQAIPGFLV